MIFIYSQITLWQYFSTVNGHNPANKEQFLRYNKVSTQWHPISFAVIVKLAYDELLFEIKF